MACDKKSFIKYVIILFLMGTMYLFLIVKYPVHIAAFHQQTSSFFLQAANITKTIGKTKQRPKPVLLSEYNQTISTESSQMLQNNTIDKVKFEATTSESILKRQNSTQSPNAQTTKHGRRRQQSTNHQKQTTEISLDNWKVEQSRRKERIRQVCKSNPHISMFRVSRTWLLYDPAHKLLFCGNAKVYTSTWMSHFHQLEAKRDGKILSQKDLQNLIPERFRLPKEITDVARLANNTISFSMVRHPFERLVSAYEDKVNYKSDMKDYAKNGYVANIKASIIREYGSVSFTNFVKHVIKEVSSSPNQVNVHWRPYYGECDYCNVPYQVILKSESYPTDLAHLGKMADLTFNTSERVHSTHSNDEVTNKYIKELPKDVLHQLYQAYKIDFEMFGYDETQYFEMKS